MFRRSKDREARLRFQVFSQKPPFVQNRMYIFALVGLLLFGLFTAYYSVLPKKKTLTETAREITSQRTEKSLTFKNKDGSFTKRLYASPVNYKDADGKWQKIDTKISAKGSKLEVTKAPYKLYFSSDSTEAVTFKLNNKSIGFTPKDISSSAATINGSKAVYKDVYMNTDLERIATSTGLKQNYILNAPGHPATFEETLNTSLTVKAEKGGSLSYYDGAKKVAVSPRPYLTDAKGITKDMDYKVSGAGSNITLSTTLPSLEGLKYPIIVDPTINKYAAGNDDTYVRKYDYMVCGNNCTTTTTYNNYPTNNDLLIDYTYSSESVGNSYSYRYYNYYRSYVRFPISDIASMQGISIISAQLRLKEHPDKTSGSAGVKLYHSAAMNPGSGAASTLWNTATRSYLGIIGQTANSYNSFDVFNNLNTDINDGNNYTYYQLRKESNSTRTFYASADYTGTSSDPYLEVVYNIAAPSLNSLTAESATQIKATVEDKSMSEDEFHFYIDQNQNPTTDDGAPIVSTTKAGIGSTYEKTYSGLSPSTQYFVRSRAHDHTTDEYSGYSDELSVYTLANPPLASTITNVGTSSSKLKVVINTNGNASNTTYAIYDEVEGKYVQVDRSLGTSPVFKTFAGWGGLNTTVRGLKPNTSHSFKVKARNGDGVETVFGPLSNTAITYASPPISLKARDFYDGSSNYNIKLTWDEAFPANPASYYHVYSSTDDGQNWTQQGGDIAQKEYTYQTSEGDYLFKVASVNSFGLENPFFVSIVLGTREANKANDNGNGTGELVIDGTNAADSTDGIKHDENNPYVLDGVHEYGSVKVQNSGVLTHSANSGGLVLKVSEKIHVDATSKIDLDGKGYPGGEGFGVGGPTGSVYSGTGGGGYGTVGGKGGGAAGGQTYGDEAAPTYMGSGGGAGYGGGSVAAGGGRIQINAHKIVVEGEIKANGLGGNTGAAGAWGKSAEGGGSGGSIWLNGTYVYNNGLLSAAGGGGGAAPGDRGGCSPEQVYVRPGEVGKDGFGGAGGDNRVNTVNGCRNYSGGSGGSLGIAGPGGDGSGVGNTIIGSNGNAGGNSAGGGGAAGPRYSAGGGGGAGRIAINYQTYNGTQVNDSNDGYADSPRGGPAGPYAYYQSTAGEQEPDLPLAPISLSALGMSFDKINLVWLNPGGTSVTGFKIYRNGMEIANTTNTSYTNIDLDPGTDYRYQLRSYNANGDLSSFSNTAFAKTFSYEYPTLDENTIYADEDTLGTLNNINSDGSSQTYVSVDMGVLNAGVEKTVSDLKYKRSYFKFPVESINKPVASATLYLDYVGTSQIIPDREEVKVDSITDYGLLSDDWSDGNLTKNPIDVGTGAQSDVTISTTRNINEFIAGYDPDNGVVPNFDNLTITPTGKLMTSNQVKLSFKVKGTLTIQEDTNTGEKGSIDASAAGYNGGTNPMSGGTGTSGSGPGGGGGGGGGDDGGGGGGYGGQGGIGLVYDGGAGGPAYGAYPQETTFGSGGGGGSSGQSGARGGRGGGAINIKATTISNNGIITADGGDPTDSNPMYISGAGSGGGIYIASPNTVDATKIFSRGGEGVCRDASRCGGGGGGGRVTIKAPLVGSADVSGGINNYGGIEKEAGDGADGSFVQLNPSNTVNVEEGAIDDWNVSVYDSSIEPSGWLNQGTAAGTLALDVTNHLEKDLARGLDYTSYRLRGHPERSDKNTYFSFASLSDFRPRLVVKMLESKAPTLTSQSDSPIQITVNTLDNSTNEDDFHYSLSTDGGFEYTDNLFPVFSDTKNTTGSFYYKTFDYLVPNTQYFVKAYAHDHDPDVESPYAQTSTHTLAIRPSAPSVSTVSQIAINISLNSDLNPVYTKYAIYNETASEYVQDDGTLAITPVYKTISDWSTITNTGLEPDTNYVYRVVAQNEDGILTNFSEQSIAKTDAEDPVSPPPDPGDVEKAPFGNIVNFYGGTEDGHIWYDYQYGGPNEKIPDDSSSYIRLGHNNVMITTSNGTRSTYKDIYRGYFTFDTSAIPSDAVITGAAINFKINSKDSSYSGGPGIDSDIEVSYANQPSWGPTLDVSDYDKQYPFVSNDKLNTADITVGNYSSIKIPLISISKSGRSEYVLRDPREWAAPTNTRDEMLLQIASSESSDKPYLAISYLTPSTNLAAPTIDSLVADSVDQITANITDNASTTEEIHFYKGINPGSTTDTGDPIISPESSKGFTGLLTNTKYYLRSRAYDYTNSWVSQYSNELEAYTLAKKPKKPILEKQGSNSIKVILNGLNGNPSYTKFAIYNVTDSKYVQADGSLDAGAVYQTYSEWGSSNGIVNTGLQSSKAYSYKVKAQNGDGIDTAFSDEASTATSVIGPTNLTATSGYNDSDGYFVDVSWEHGDPASPASYYNLQVSTNDGRNWTVLQKNIVGTSYRHKTLKARTTYKYRVFAANSEGEENSDVNYLTNTWTQTSDSDFNAGTNQNTIVTGGSIILDEQQIEEREINEAVIYPFSNNPTMDFTNIHTNLLATKTKGTWSWDLYYTPYNSDRNDGPFKDRAALYVGNPDNQSQRVSKNVVSQNIQGSETTSWYDGNSIKVGGLRSYRATWYGHDTEVILQTAYFMGYYPDGTFTSTVKDSFEYIPSEYATYNNKLRHNKVSWLPTDQTAGASMEVQLKGGDSATPDASWTSWKTFANGQKIPEGLNEKRYIQYKALLSTVSDQTAKLDEIKIDTIIEATDPNYPTASATTAYPEAPTNLSGLADNAVDIQLNWDAPTGAVTIDGYRVYRNDKEIADVKTTDYEDRVNPKTSYNYYVKAYDKFGYLSDSSNSTTVGSLGMPHGFFKDNTDVCAGCHRSHTATGEGIITEELQKDLCYTCHDGSGSNYNVKEDFGEMGTPKSSTHPVPTAGLKCSDCHDPHGSKDENGNYYPRILRAEKPDGSFVYQGNEFCGACHGPNSPLQGKPGEDHLANFTGTPHDVNLVEPPSGTKIKCVNCHDKHASDTDALLNNIINGLNIAGNNNGVCFTCHKDDKYAFSGRNVFEQTKHSEVSDRDIVDTSDGGYAMGDCKNCHNPHGTPFTDYRRKDRNELCSTCHDKKAPPTEKVATDGTYNTPLLTGGFGPKLPINIKSLGKITSNDLGPEDRFIKARLNLMLYGVPGSPGATTADIYGYDNPYSAVVEIYINSISSIVGAEKVGSWTEPLYIVGTKLIQFDVSNWLNNNKNEEVFIVIEINGKTMNGDPVRYAFDSVYEDNNPASTLEYYAYQGADKYNQSAHGSTTNLNTRWPNSSETGSGIGTGGATAGECINCHNPHGKKDENGKPFPKMLQDKEEDFCFTCHDKPENSVRGINIKERFTIADSTISYILDNYLSRRSARHSVTDDDGPDTECTSCHNPHLNNAQDKVIDPDNKSVNFTDTMTDPVSGDVIMDINGFCLKCHNKRLTLTPLPSKHDYGVAPINYNNNFHGNAEATGLYQPIAPGPEIDRDIAYGPMKPPYSRGMSPLPCTTCHDEHGSSNILHFKEEINGQTVNIRKLIPNSGWEPLCQACHEPTSMINAHMVNCGFCHSGESWYGVGNPPRCGQCHNHSGAWKGIYPFGQEVMTEPRSGAF